MNYLTKSRFFELIDQGEMIYDKKSEYRELLDYQIILQDQIFYANRFQYINLIKNYIDGGINCYAFQWDFFELHQEHMKIFDNLIKNLNQSSSITFSTDSKIKHVSLLINEMVDFCEFLDEGVTEERFDKEIKKIYKDMQKYASSIHSNMEQEYENLVSSSFKFLGINLGLSILLLFF